MTSAKLQWRNSAARRESIMRGRKISKYSMIGDTSVSTASSSVMSFSLRLTLISEAVTAWFTRSWMSNEVDFGLRTRLRCTSLLSAMITAADTALTVLGVADRAGLLVGGADEDLHALVALHHLERGSLALGLDRRARLRLRAVDLLLFIRRVGVIGARTRCLNGVCHGETLIRRA